jgi:hypothetical protein
LAIATTTTNPCPPVPYNGDKYPLNKILLDLDAFGAGDLTGIDVDANKQAAVAGIYRGSGGVIGYSVPDAATRSKGVVYQLSENGVPNWAFGLPTTGVAQQLGG